VALAEEAAEYIERARTETLRSINVEVRPEMIQPIPHAVYVLAYTAAGRMAGIAEALLLSQHYESFDHAPYGSVAGLRELCPFELMAGIRTVYVEPDFRLRRALYLKLILSQAYIFRTLGARYSTATTNASAERLARLYQRTGGLRLGVFGVGEWSAEGAALWAFEVERLLRHPGLERTLKDADFDFARVQAIRQRNRWNTASA